jgi:hypothetical protein
MDKGNGIYKHVIDSQVFPYLFQNENSNLANHSNSNNSTELVKALCVLCFDDEIGQVAENIYPPNCLDKVTMKNISGLGFPETNYLTDDGEVQFIFKIRQSKNF